MENGNGKALDRSVHSTSLNLFREEIALKKVLLQLSSPTKPSLLVRAKDAQNICSKHLHVHHLFQEPKWPKSFLAVQISNLQTVKNHGSKASPSSPLHLTITGDSCKRSIGCLENSAPNGGAIIAEFFCKWKQNTGSVSSANFYPKTPEKKNDVPTQWF